MFHCPALGVVFLRTAVLIRAVDAGGFEPGQDCAALARMVMILRLSVLDVRLES